MDTLATSGAASTGQPAAQTSVKTDHIATPAAPVAAPDVAKTAVPGTEATGANTTVPAATAVVEAKYELKAPEGFDGDLKEVVEFAKANKITEEAAQKMLERDHARTQQVREASVKAHEEKQIQTWEKKVSDWAEETRADKEIGGHNLAVTQENTRRVLTKYDADGLFAKELNATGFGNHPVVLRFLNSIGKAMGEGRFIAGSPAAAVPNAQSIYSKSNMKP